MCMCVRSLHFKTTIKEQPAQLHNSSVLAAVEVQLTEEAVLDIIEHVTMYSIRGTLALKLEHNHTAVMT